MFKKTWKFLNWGSRWIAIINGTILFAVGVTLVALGDSPVWLLFSAFGLLALYLGIFKPGHWSTSEDTEGIKK